MSPENKSVLIRWAEFLGIVGVIFAVVAALYLGVEHACERSHERDIEKQEAFAAQIAERVVRLMEKR